MSAVSKRLTPASKQMSTSRVASATSLAPQALKNSVPPPNVPVPKLRTGTFNPDLPSCRNSIERIDAGRRKMILRHGWCPLPDAKQRQGTVPVLVRTPSPSKTKDWTYFGLEGNLLSLLPRGGSHAFDTSAGYSLCVSPTPQDSRLHCNRRAHACLRNRGQCRDLHPGERRHDEEASCGRA